MREVACAVLTWCLAATGCRQILGIDDPIVRPADAAQPGADAALADVLPDGIPPDASAILTFQVSCGPTRTARELCQSAGYAGAASVRGFGWWQCGGPINNGVSCPGGFVGLSCQDWCAASDCVGYAYCGQAHSVIEVNGDADTGWSAAAIEALGCGAFSPGWILRATCTQ